MYTVLNLSITLTLFVIKLSITLTLFVINSPEPGQGMLFIQHYVLPGTTATAYLLVFVFVR
jgi:hypothetical protein